MLATHHAFCVRHAVLSPTPQAAFELWNMFEILAAAKIELKVLQGPQIFGVLERHAELQEAGELPAAVEAELKMLDALQIAQTVTEFPAVFERIAPAEVDLDVLRAIQAAHAAAECRDVAERHAAGPDVPFSTANDPERKGIQLSAIDR